ncbi:MAG: hypothetical protein LIP11_12370 [Clostridiales bacterium]|nr:hypothetical protein [Clostridiales bacterium]
MKGYKNVGIPKTKQLSMNKERRRHEKYLQAQKKNGSEIRRVPDAGWKTRVYSSPVILQDDAP